MRRARKLALTGLTCLALAGCQKPGDPDVTRGVDRLNVIDSSNLTDVMLNAADPAEAVAYFQRSLVDDPDRIEFQRGLAVSLVRAGRPSPAASAWKTVTEHPDATVDDRVDYADALIRAGDWEGAKGVLDSIPPTHETFKRYRLEAMVADSQQDWDRSDSFYETAVGLTTQPAPVLNNWGYSKLTRGDFPAAERLFAEAIQHDQSLFTAKNNLVLARGAQRKYQMPVVPVTQIERAQLLHTLGLAAIKQGDVQTGKTLLQDAIETHPQHFEAAVLSLRTLEGT